MHLNRKCQDYDYVENKEQNWLYENKVLYCKALRCETAKNTK